MIWFLSALLTAAVLSFIDCTFVLLTCGPFWMNAGLFLKTWLSYAALCLIGFALLNLCWRWIPPLKRWFPNPVQRFRLNVLLGWFAGNVLLISLIFRTLETKLDNPILFQLVLLTGVVLLLSLPGLRKSGRSLPIFALSLSVLPFLIFLGIRVQQNSHYAALLNHRKADYHSDIPHIGLIVFDTVRRDHLSCYGYSFPTTPHLDQIAREGLLFSQAFSAANWTPPGHISIFTGKFPPQHGNNGQVFMPDKLVSLTEILNQRGYFCAAIYVNPLAGRDVNITQGFDCDIGILSHSWVYPAPLTLWNKVVLKDTGAKIAFQLAAATFTWTQQRDGHLFLFLNVVDPHAPYTFREPYFSQFTRNLKNGEIGNWNQTLQFCRATKRTICDSARFTGCNDQSLAYIRAAYDSEVAYMDRHFGELISSLRCSEVLDKTLLLLTSDHGEFLGEYATMGHPKLLFNPVLEIPLILRYPSRIPPGVNDNVVSNVDIFATVLNLTGLQGLIPADVPSLDLLGPQSGQARALLSANLDSTGFCYSWLDDRYKLIVNRDDFFAQHFPFDTLLFNLAQDPAEAYDLHRSDPVRLQLLARELAAAQDSLTVLPQGEIKISTKALENMKALGYVQ